MEFVQILFSEVSVMSKGNDIGGHTIIRDPAFSIKVAGNLRNTKQSEQRRARERERSLKLSQLTNRVNQS
jgi:hypothetical protein